MALDQSGNAEGEGSHEMLDSSDFLRSQGDSCWLDAGAPCDLGGHLWSGKFHLRFRLPCLVHFMRVVCVGTVLSYRERFLRSRKSAGTMLSPHRKSFIFFLAAEAVSIIPGPRSSCYYFVQGSCQLCLPNKPVCTLL